MKRVGAFIWNNMTMLDVLGPHQLLGFQPDFEVFTVAATRDPIVTDTGVTITPDHSVLDAPPVDIVLTGGGADPSREMSDPDVMDWFRKNGENADWVTSVCSGSLILAAAGLLDGYRATTHWSHYDDLALWPAIDVVRDQRVVLDRNRMTAGGVTAGIDFALHLITAVSGEESSARTQLLMEYDPAPPTDFGHPRNCPPEMVAGVVEMLRPLRGGLDAFLANQTTAK